MFWNRVRPGVHGARMLGWTSIALGFTELIAPDTVERMLGIDEHQGRSIHSKPVHAQQGSRQSRQNGRKGVSAEDSVRHERTIRLLGIREILHGVSILTQDSTSPYLAPALWARCAGDVLDTAFLGIAGTQTKRPGRFAVVATVVTAISVLDLVHAVKLSRSSH